MASHVTAAQTRLWDRRTIPEQIDEVLRQCLLHSRPVYIEVPTDLVAAPVSGENLSSTLALPKVQPTPTQESAIAKVLDRIHAAQHPMILVDGETRAFGILDDVQSFSKSTNWPTWTTGFAKGLLNESEPNYHGVYRGRFDEPSVQKFVQECDLILCFGPHFSSTNSYALSSIPKVDITISFSDTKIILGNEVLQDLPAKHAISQILQKLDFSKVKSYKQYPDLPHDRTLSFAEVSSDQKITQDKAWKLLANFIRPGDIVLGETGTAAYGVREFPLPPHTRLFTSVTWLSIGYMLPAAQGAALAQRELIKASKYHGIENARTVLFIGDGSFQMTVQELATMIHHKLDVVVFLINNDGYTIERCIHGLKQRYNDISNWRYLKAPALFGADEDTFTGSAKTFAELEKVLGDDRLNNGKGLRMVEVFMDREDAPEGPLMYMMGTQKDKATQA